MSLSRKQQKDASIKSKGSFLGNIGRSFKGGRKSRRKKRKSLRKKKSGRKTHSKRQRGSGACHSLECRHDVNANDDYGRHDVNANDDYGRHDVNAKDDYGRTALHKAGKAGDVEEVLSLLEQPGIDVNMKNNNGRTTLMEASTAGRTEIVQMLLEKGADLDVKDDNGKTALMMVKDENIYFPEVETAIEKIARILRHEAQKRREALFGVALRLGTEKSNTSAARVLGQTVKVNNDEKKLDIHHFANEINKYVGGRKSLKKRRKSIKRY